MLHTFRAVTRSFSDLCALLIQHKEQVDNEGYHAIVTKNVCKKRVVR
jgi:hypothetical protein